MYFTKIAFREVIAIQEEESVALFESMIFDRETLTCRMLLVRKPALLTLQKRYVLWDDVIGFDSFIQIQSSEAMMEAEDLVRHQDIIEGNCELINMEVALENGNKIGVVIDFLVDLTTGEMIHFVMKGFNIFKKQERIIPREAIIRVEKSIIFINETLAFDLLSDEKEQTLGKKTTMQIPIQTIKK